MYICMYVCMYVCMYTYVYMYVCMYVCMYTYIYIYHSYYISNIFKRSAVCIHVHTCESSYTHTHGEQNNNSISTEIAVFQSNIMIQNSRSKANSAWIPTLTLNISSKQLVASLPLPISCKKSGNPFFKTEQ